MANQLKSSNANATTSTLQQHLDDRIVAATHSVYTGSATLATFFAGFTLNIVVSADTKDRPNVRLWAAISAMLFVNGALLSVGCGIVFAIIQNKLLKTYRQRLDDPKLTPEEKRRLAKWKRVGMVCALGPVALFIVMITGIFFFLLVLYSYERVIGIIGFVVAGCGVIVGGSTMIFVVGMVVFKEDVLERKLMQ